MLALLFAVIALPPLAPLLVTLVILGVVLWLVETKIPMDDTIRVVFRVVVAIAACIWLLRLIGVGV